MKRQHVLILCLSVLLAGIGFFLITLLSKQPPESPSPKTISAEQLDLKTVPPKSVAQLGVTVTEKTHEPVTESFRMLTQAYSETLQYPPYSLPLNDEDVHLMHPNRYLPQTLPLEGGASATLLLDKYRFSYPEPVSLQLQISDLIITAANIKLIDEQTLKVVSQAQMQYPTAQGSTSQWHATLAANKDWDGPFTITVTFSANGQSQTISTGIEYSNPVATITGIKPSRSAGSDMQIPVQLDVKQGGYYRLRANLLSGNHKPLALLTMTERLSKGNNEIILRAHKSALRGHEGPYILGTFILERRPATPGEQTRYGNSEQDEYPIEYFGLHQLSDTPWQPTAEEQQRLQFLKQMAQQ